MPLQDLLQVVFLVRILQRKNSLQTRRCTEVSLHRGFHRFRLRQLQCLQHQSLK